MRSLLLLAALAAGPALAFHRSTPGAVRLTQGDAVTLARTRSWQRFVAFATTEPLLHDGATGRQIYRFSLFDYDCARQLPNAGDDIGQCPEVVPPHTIRVTSGPGDPDNPSIDKTGTLVAFDADGSYGGGTGEGVGRRQIFVLNLTTNALTRVTSAGDGDSVKPSFSEKGGMLVFESTAGMFGPSGTPQVYTYSLRRHALRRVTNGAGPSRNAMLNRVGTLVAFESSADLLGAGDDTGITQIFWFDLKTNVLGQLTAGDAPSRNPWISSRLRSRSLRQAGLRRPAIFFESGAATLNGAPAGPDTQVYAGSTRLGSLPPLLRVTPIAAPGCTPPVAGSATFPSIDESGSHILFVSTGDLLCNGTTGPRLFAFDVRNTPPVLYQVAGRGEITGGVSASLGLWFAVVATSNDMTGTGTCGTQLHVIDYYEGGYGATSVAGQTPFEPTPGDPNAGCDDAVACTVDACVSDVCQHTPVDCGP